MHDYTDIFRQKRICPNPFLSLEINQNGDVSVCCTARLKEEHKFIGNILHNSLDEIWNSPASQTLRGIMYEGMYLKACEPFCPQLIAFSKGHTPPWYAMFCEEDTYREIKIDKRILNSPYRAISVASDGSCNLHCIMCRSKKQLKPSESGNKVNAVLFDQLLEKLPQIRFLELTGQGDPFFNKDIGHFLDRLATRETRHLIIRFITNGQLLNEKQWKKINRLKLKEIRISVSIDAATQKTYETIRRGGNWEHLVNNMEMLSQKRLEDALSHLTTSFVVMGMNIHEMIPFIHKAKSWNCDRIEFQRIFGTTAGLENIFDIEDPGSLEKLAEVLKNPIIDDPMIDVSSFLPYTDYRSTPDKLKRYQHEMLKYKIKRIANGALTYLSKPFRNSFRHFERIRKTSD